MRRPARTLFLALSAAAILVASQALAETTVIHVNQSRRVLLPGAAANVIIGDPSVADVTLLDAHSIILSGKAYGATEVLVLDHAGRTLLDDRVMVGAPETGVVTLHRGTSAAEYSCSPRCQALAPSKDSGGAAAGAGVQTNVPAAAPTPAP